MKIPFSVYDFFGYLAAGFVLLCTIDFAFGGGWLLAKEIWPTYVVFWTVVAYVAGHLIANVSKFALEDSVVRRWLGAPEETLFDETPRHSRLSRVLPAHYKPFPPATRQRILTKARKIAELEGPSRALFLHAHPIAMREKHVQERLSTFLSLYGFCRNMCLTCAIAVPILLLGMLVDFKGVKLLWCAVAVIAAVGLFYRYLKFFKHYTEDVFRAYAESPENG